MMSAVTVHLRVRIGVSRLSFTILDTLAVYLFSIQSGSTRNARGMILTGSAWGAPAGTPASPGISPTQSRPGSRSREPSSASGSPGGRDVLSGPLSLHHAHFWGLDRLQQGHDVWRVWGPASRGTSSRLSSEQLAGPAVQWFRQVRGEAWSGRPSPVDPGRLPACRPQG